MSRGDLRDHGFQPVGGAFGALGQQLQIIADLAELRGQALRALDPRLQIPPGDLRRHLELMQMAGGLVGGPGEVADQLLELARGRRGSRPAAC